MIFLCVHYCVSSNFKKIIYCECLVSWAEFPCKCNCYFKIWKRSDSNPMNIPVYNILAYVLTDEIHYEISVLDHSSDFCENRTRDSRYLSSLSISSSNKSYNLSQYFTIKLKMWINWDVFAIIRFISFVIVRIALYTK